MVREIQDSPPTSRQPNSAAALARSLEVGRGMICDTRTEFHTAKSAMRVAGYKTKEQKTREGWKLWRVA